MEINGNKNTTKFNFAHKTLQNFRSHFGTKQQKSNLIIILKIIPEGKKNKFICKTNRRNKVEVPHFRLESETFLSKLHLSLDFIVICVSAVLIYVNGALKYQPLIDLAVNNV